jgi:4-alpha-glucanotransferase
VAERYGLPIGLYLDVAAGVAPAGADAWAWPEWFLRGVSMGAPPDAYNANGQDWGLCAFNPQALTNCDFAPFRQMLGASMHHAGAVRLDHVLGLNRTFLVPAGLPAHRGGYVRFPFEGMLAVVAQESNRARCLVIGEDLGTVPAGLPAMLRRWGVWSYRVVLFERERDGSFRSPADYPEDAVVAFNTHDLPTFAGWLTGRDLAIKRALDLDPGETSDERAHARAALTETLRRASVGGTGEPTFLDCVRFMARSRSRLLVVSLEDALGVVEQPNLPGTVDEHPNWQRKTPVAVEDLAAHPNLCALADALAAEGRSAGRRR